MTDQKIIKVTLNHPITINGETLEEIAIRKPKSGELRGISLLSLGRLEVDELMKLIPRISMTALSDKDIEALETNDLMKIGTEITSFLLL